MLFVSPVIAVDNPPRSVVIRDWNITIPSDTEDHKTDGPDFSVTYFVFPKLKSQFGIYEGGHPQEFAAEQKDVTKQKDKICGQDVVWSLWKEKAEGREFMRAELFVVCAVNRIPNMDVTYEEKFHIFLLAPDSMSLATLQDIIRTLRKKTA